MFQRRHPDEHPKFEEYRKSKLKRRQKTQLNELPHKKSPIQTTLPFARKQQPKINQRDFNEKITAFVVDGMYPLSIVENEKFKDLFSGEEERNLMR